MSSVLHTHVALLPMKPALVVEWKKWASILHQPSGASQNLEDGSLISSSSSSLLGKGSGGGFWGNGGDDGWDAMKNRFGASKGGTSFEEEEAEAYKDAPDEDEDGEDTRSILFRFVFLCIGWRWALCTFILFFGLLFYNSSSVVIVRDSQGYRSRILPALVVYRLQHFRCERGVLTSIAVHNIRPDNPADFLLSCSTVIIVVGEDSILISFPSCPV